MSALNKCALIIILLLLPILASNAGAEPARPVIVDYTALAEKQKAALPSNWKLYKSTKRYTPLSLYEKINGAAELYLAYGFKEMFFASYEDKKDANNYIDISVYDMGAPIRAFGIFSAEFAPDGDALKMGTKSYQGMASQFIWKGRFYIKVESSESDKKMEEIAGKLAQITSKFLPAEEQDIWGFNLLPKKNLIPDSIKYFYVDAMGLDFMDNTFTAQYKFSNMEPALFVSKQKSVKDAKEALQKYQAHAQKYGQGCKTRYQHGQEFLVCQMDDKVDSLFLKGPYLFGITSPFNKKTNFGLDFWKAMAGQ